MTTKPTDKKPQFGGAEQIADNFKSEVQDPGYAPIGMRGGGNIKGGKEVVQPMIQ